MKKIAVFGIGISGLSLINYLLERNKRVIAIDDKPSALEDLKNRYQNKKDFLQNIEFCFDKKAINWQEVEFLVVSPSVPLKYPKPHEIVELANQNNCPIIGDIELFYRFNNIKNFIGITGTNGKSTTTALTGHIFKESGVNSEVGGNIGIPCFDLGEAENYIFEVSSYQLDLIEKTKFHIGAILNVTPDHLDRHKDMNGYIEAKKRIFLNQSKDDILLLNLENKACFDIYQELKKSDFKGQIFAISLENQEDSSICFLGDKIFNKITNKEIEIGELPYLKGDHNKQNLLFAYSIAYFSKISDEKIVKAVKSFSGLKHRAQPIAKIKNVNFINDSKATNVESTICALGSYDKIFWIAGGISKTNDLSELKPYLERIDKAFLIGKDQQIFADFLEENKKEYYICDNLDKAFKNACDIAFKQNYDLNILLSPACASFDQWKNFEERGDYFCQLVNKISHEK